MYTVVERIHHILEAIITALYLFSQQSKIRKLEQNWARLSNYRHFVLQQLNDLRIWHHISFWIVCLKSSLFSLCWKCRNLISLYLHRVGNSRVPEMRISWISTKLLLIVIQPWRSWSIAQSFKVLVKVSPIDDWINTAVEDGSEEENIRDIFRDLKIIC
jgi:hypothetical protein